MKLGIIITQTDPEAVFNVLRLALYSLKEGDHVKIFLSGCGVEIDQIQDPAFDIKSVTESILKEGGIFFACGTCLKFRQSNSSETCPFSTLKDHYEIVRDSDRIITI